MIKVMTHDGKFHPDEIFASVLLAYFKKQRISFVRTRDEQKLERARHDQNVYLIDVGGKYDPFMNNFDHHQSTFTDVGDRGDMLSSCGLIWRHIRDDLDISDELKQRVTEFTIAVDKHDNGVAYFETVEFITTFNSSPKKNRFMAAFRAAFNVFENYVRLWMHLEEVGKHEDVAIMEAEDGVIYSEEKLSVNEKLNGSGNQLLVCKRGENEYTITSLNVGYETDFSVRCPAPSEWAGLQGDEIKQYDERLVFCHKNLFLTIVHGSKEDAIEVAKKIAHFAALRKRDVAFKWLETFKNTSH